MPLAAQSRDEPEPYSRPASTISGTPSAAYRIGGVVDERLLAVGQVDRVRALLARRQQVAQADVREGAADHHLVLAAPGAVRVELERADAVRLEPLPGRRPGGDRAGRRDVVGRDRVAEHRQDARPDDVARPAPVDAGTASKNGGRAM